MTTEHHILPLAKLKLNDENPNDHDDESIEVITASLLRFGQVEPVVADRVSKVVLAGNGRCLALMKIAEDCAIDYETRQRALAWGLVVERNTGKLVKGANGKTTKEPHTVFLPQVKVIFNKFQDGLEAKAYALVDNRSAQFSKLNPARVDETLLACEQAHREWSDLGFTEMDWEAVRLAAKKAEEATKPQQPKEEEKTNSGSGKQKEKAQEDDPEPEDDDPQPESEFRTVTLTLELERVELAEFSDLMAIMNHHHVSLGKLVMSALKEKSIKLLDESQD